MYIQPYALFYCHVALKYLYHFRIDAIGSVHKRLNVQLLYIQHQSRAAPWKSGFLHRLNVGNSYANYRFPGNILGIF